MAFALRFLVSVLLFAMPAIGENKCQKLVRDLGSSKALYVQCVLTHAAPVEICMSCVQEYRNMETVYNNFTAGSFNGTKCADIYVDQDNLNIISHTHYIMTKLWDEAFCSECYNANGTPNDDTIQFEDFTIKYEGCIEVKQNFCVQCKVAYKSLNNLFEDLKEKYKRKVCFDIQDKMNRTRRAWTKSCGHDSPNGNLVAFAAVSSVLISIPVLFYCGVFIHTYRSLQNLQTLDVETEAERGNVTTVQSADTQEDARNQPSTSTNSSNVRSSVDAKATTKLIDIDDDEDLLDI